MRRLITISLKLILPAALFALLLWNVDAEDYRAFWEQPKRWHLLLAAQIVALAGVMLSFIRWRLLVRAFHIPFSLREALRLGFLGYLLNFVSFGSVGGDLFKAILVARDKPQRRPEAVASVLLDRAIGLLGLVLLASLCLRVFADDGLSPVLVTIRRGAELVAGVGLVGVVVGLYAGNWCDRLIDWVGGWPVAGETLARMARAVRLLRKCPWLLVVMVGCSLLIHSLMITSMYLISIGIYAQTPSYREHFMIIPPAMAAGTLPLAPGGLGYQEGAIAGMFRLLPSLPDGFSGILVATIYRLITLSIAGIGLIFYWTSHGREFRFSGEKSVLSPLRPELSESLAVGTVESPCTVRTDS
ncbi:MAG: hypothetical protein KatS3mg111_3726 [Pirellulaceae bacterium]|nr:MAG: hypothetical protein KatS3mg111_3726 [Pirellulaceae bacterium]